MMQTTLRKIVLSSFIVIVAVGGLLLTSQAVSANSIADNVCRGILSTEGTASGIAQATQSSCFENGENGFSHLVRRIIDVFSIVVGAVSVIMIIIGGFRYIISGGDSAGVSAAKNTILYAIVGLVIVIFAQAIIRFVYSNVSPTNNLINPATIQLY